jgi:hypothetical protein
VPGSQRLCLKLAYGTLATCPALDPAAPPTPPSVPPAPDAEPLVPPSPGAARLPGTLGHLACNAIPGSTAKPDPRRARPHASARSPLLNASTSRAHQSENQDHAGLPASVLMQYPPLRGAGTNGLLHDMLSPLISKVLPLMFPQRAVSISAVLS